MSLTLGFMLLYVSYMCEYIHVDIRMHLSYVYTRKLAESRQMILSVKAAANS